MSAQTVAADLDGIRRRTNRAFTLSLLVHVLFLLLTTFIDPISPEEMGITEITWLEPEKIVTAPEPAARPSPPKPEKKPSGSHDRREHFPRELPRAETAPTPQEMAAVQDRVLERIESLQNRTSDDVAVAAIATPAAAFRPKLAEVSSARPSSAPQELTRGETPSAAPKELVRGTKAPAPPVTLSRIPDEGRTRDAPQAMETESVTREVLAGVSLAGPVANRKLLSYRLPEYPEWAKRDAVEGTVRLHFVVLSGGGVKENVQIERTSGFRDFDENALLALLDWQFEPLQTGTTGEQWGSITLDYRLTD